MHLTLAALLAAFSPQAVTPLIPSDTMFPGSRPATPEEKARTARQVRATANCHRRFMGEDYLPQPAIWKIADADTAIYLFGTVHELPDDFEWRTPQLDAIVSRARLLITETGLRAVNGPVERDRDPAAPGTATPLPPIADRLSGEQRAKWLGMAAMMRDDLLARFDRMPTTEAALLIGIEPDRWHQPPMVNGVDNQLKADFVKAGKPVSAIEDGNAVVGRVEEMDEGEKRNFLASQVDAVAARPTLNQRMAAYHKWASGTFSLPRLTADRPANEGLRLRLLGERNAAWAETIAGKMAEPGNILVAVGAGHLQGDDSLIAQLAKRGWKAELMSPSGPPRPRPWVLPMPANWDECSDYLLGKKAVPPGIE